MITGPSGVGKGTLIRGLLERVPELGLSISATTRAPRPGETQGVDYHFLGPEEFEQRVADGEFVEHATYSGRRYGTLRSELEGRLRRGEPVVLEIEVQGARQVREAMPEALQVFIAPPSREALRARLVGRGTDTPDQVDARLRTAEGELEAQSEFSHVVVNDRLEDALDELVDIVRGEWRRLHHLLRVGRAAIPGTSMRLSRGGVQMPCRQRREPCATCTSAANLGGQPTSEGPTLISPRIDKLLDHVDSDYASVLVAAKRARQINSYYHNLGEGTFDEFPPPMVDTRSKNYLTIALEEVAQGKLKYHYR